jgi:hypothetical protein
MIKFKLIPHSFKPFSLIGNRLSSNGTVTNLLIDWLFTEGGHVIG